MIAHGMFVVNEAGRSLGLDHLLRRSPPAFLTTAPFVARAFDLAT
jgi:hypothetical protein